MMARAWAARATGTGQWQVQQCKGTGGGNNTAGAVGQGKDMDNSHGRKDIMAREKREHGQQGWQGLREHGWQEQ